MLGLQRNRIPKSSPQSLGLFFRTSGSTGREAAGRFTPPGWR